MSLPIKNWDSGKNKNSTARSKKNENCVKSSLGDISWLNFIAFFHSREVLKNIEKYVAPVKCFFGCCPYYFELKKQLGNTLRCLLQICNKKINFSTTVVTAPDAVSSFGKSVKIRAKIYSLLTHLIFENSDYKCQAQYIIEYFHYIKQ